MAIFKRGRVYWYHFVFNGQHIQRSTKQGNPRTARQMEAACKTALAKGEVGILERKRQPTLREFSQRFIDHVQAHHADKPRTLEFYAEKVCRLLEFGPLATAHLNQIDEALIETYIQARRPRVRPRSTATWPRSDGCCASLRSGALLTAYQGFACYRANTPASLC